MEPHEIVLSVEMVAITVFVSGVITGMITWARVNFKKTTDDSKAIKQGVLALLRGTIINYYTKYNDEMGYAPVHIKQVVTELHKHYDALSGNGATHRFYEDLMALPTSPGGPPSDWSE